MWIGILIAMISGALMSVQGVFNAGVTKETSIWVSSSFVQFTALIVCVLAWFFTGRDGNFKELLGVNHKYMLLGGVMGAFITYTVIKSLEIVGPAKAAMLIVVTQLIISYIIEIFGMFGIEKVEFEWRKCIGLGIVIIGLITFKWE